MGSARGTDLVVVGLGNVGLPLVQGAVRSGKHVVGIDRSQLVVDGLNSGRSHVDDISDADVAAMLASGFTATADSFVIGSAASVVTCAPTPLTDHGAPDLSAVNSAVEPATDLFDEAEHADLTIALQPHRVIDVVELADRADLLLDTRGRTAGHPRAVQL
jgi:UDP-N-acetyl-D-glucosamine dehydrogenase